MEEEDIKDKFLRNKAEKIMLDMQNTDIKNIQEKIEKLKEAEIEEEKKKQDEASGKRRYDIKKVLEIKK